VGGGWVEVPHFHIHILSPSRVTRDNFLWQTNFLFLFLAAPQTEIEPRGKRKSFAIGTLRGKGNEKVLNISQKRSERQFTE